MKSTAHRGRAKVPHMSEPLDLKTIPSPGRVGSLEHFTHKALGIVDDVLRVTAIRNEHAIAVARLVLATAFALRLIALYPEYILAGNPKDVGVLAFIIFGGAVSLLHLLKAPKGSFQGRQIALMAVDVMMMGVATLPAVLIPEPNYRGLLLTPFCGLGALVAVAGGLRLRRSFAVVTAVSVMAMFVFGCVLDVILNPDLVAWGIGEVIYYVVELGGAGLLGVLVASRTMDLATRSAAKAIDAERARERLGSYVGREVAEEALAADQIVLGGSRQPVTVLFSDLRGFTTYSERLAPEALVTQLNAYLEEMVAVIMRHGGVVDKYIGDGIMAVFGAPKPKVDDAHRAILAARDLHEALIRHNKSRALLNLPPLKMGIGVHHGPVVAGNIGTLEHAQYTIIGDTVNLASRLESATKDLGVDVLISRAAKDAAVELTDTLTPMGNLAVRGRSDAVEVFTLAGVKPEVTQPPVNIGGAADVESIAAGGT